MITIILEAFRIPDGTIVRKTTGINTYTLSRQVAIYGEARQKIEMQGVVFLIGENASINGYVDTTKFAIDLENQQAISFLKSVIGKDND